MRRTRCFSLYVFFFISYLFTQETETSIIISHYQYPVTEGIPIILDITDKSTYLLDEENPSILLDGQLNTLKLDGSIGIPLGSYFLPNFLPKEQHKDSMLNHSQIYYRKGDYDYNDLGIELQIENTNNGFISLQGYKHSPPKLYQTKSNELQNYLLSYKNHTDKVTVRLDALYHIENYDLPLDIVYKTRYTESFHGGLGIDYNLNNFSINLQPSFQFTNLNQQGEKNDHFTFWNTLNSTFNFWSNFNISLNHTYKMRMNEYNGQLSEMPIQIISPSMGYNNEHISLTGGIASTNSTLNPVGRLQFTWDHFSLSAARNYNVSFVPSYNYSLDTVAYTSCVLNAKYSDKQFNTTLGLFRYDEKSSWGLKGNGNINLLWISLNQQVGIYNLNENTNTHPLDLYSLTKMIFSPNLWFWKTGRYQPFIGIESIYIQHSGTFGIDPPNPGVFSNMINPFSSHLVNMEFGFLVKGFKVSSRWVNFNISGSKVNNSVNSDYYPIQPIRHLEVVWQFMN